MTTTEPTMTAAEIAVQQLAHHLVALTELPLTRELAGQISRCADELAALAEAA